MIRWIGNRFAMITALLVLFYLFLPVAYTFAFSFNNYKKSNISWNPEGSPTLKHWKDPCGAPGVCESLVTSIQIGVIATVIATVLGTMLAFAMVRHRFRGRGTSNVLVFVPMATPEIVLGASLLTIFVQGFSNVGLQLGFWTIVIAHIMFCVSFVALTVKARVRGFDWTLEDASLDLGCSPWRTFRKVTFPLILPGIMAAALLSFALSLDDYIITDFTKGEYVTFPIQVNNQFRISFPPQVNVLATIILVVSVLLLVVTSVREDRSSVVGR